MAELTLGDLFEKDPEAYMALYGCMVGIAQTIPDYGRFRDIPVSAIQRLQGIFKLGGPELSRLEAAAKVPFGSESEEPASLTPGISSRPLVEPVPASSAAPA